MKTQRVEVLIDVVLRSDNSTVKSSWWRLTAEVVMNLKSIQAVP